MATPRTPPSENQRGGRRGPARAGTRTIVARRRHADQAARAPAVLFFFAASARSSSQMVIGAAMNQVE